MLKETPKLFLKTISLVEKEFVPKIQKGRELRVFPRKNEDSRLDFSKDIDWNYSLIRASSKPLPGAYSFLNNSDQKVIIYRAEPYSVNYDFCAISGQIIEIFEDNFSFLLAIGNDVLNITEYSVNNLSTKKSFKIVCNSLRNRLT